ncbi:MAG: 2-hydroxyglutaryl-CoA dehydratase [Mogibacterium sp.]|nr:2-hydroxyglutaryl-CoA dehydratase [Mogibacterium sp.]MBR2541098.1 2-hydroxyglutaryl-CoA dehydratase [Mogibacterium sp.]
MLTLGIDIGSTTSKCILMEDGSRIIAKSLRIGGLGTEGPEEALQDLWNETSYTRDDVSRVIVTGYGRNKYEGADGEVSELTCHALGGRFIFPDLRTVIDIGGQDAKIITLNESGRMSNFVMNDKCAAGTGRFLDVMANILRMDIDDLDECASKSEKPASISSTCTVFAESEVISQLANGVSRPDLVAGICESVASRVSALARRAGVVPRVCMSGGVAKNSAVRHALEKNLETEISFDPMAQYFGAIGAALYGFRQLNK